MSQRWPWFKFFHGFVWWPVCWQGWAVILAMWAIAGAALLFPAEVRAMHPLVLIALVFVFFMFAGSKTEFPPPRWPQP
jgi:hypothetical protein